MSRSATYPDRRGQQQRHSAPVHITIVANNPPTLTLATVPAARARRVEHCNTATITDNDPGGSIRRVEFYLDGALTVTDTTSPFTYELCDVLAGTHTLYAVAVDQANARGYSATNSLTATNPADVTVIVPNGSTWKYFDKGTDQGTGGVPWAGLLFDDTGWSNGVAELGYGDNGNNRPETTVIGYGPNANTKFITTYFRKSFAVGDPSGYTNLIVRCCAMTVALFTSTAPKCSAPT